MEIITADCSRADLVESLMHLSRTAGRLPSHYVERRAALHADIDLLLGELEVRGELRV
jgi:hypothetical protein